MSHFIRFDEPIEILAAEKSQFNCRLAQADALLVRVLRNLRGLVVPNVRIQGRYQHQRILYVRFNLFAIEFDPGDAVGDKTMCSIVKQSYRMQEVMNHHWLEYI